MLKIGLVGLAHVHVTGYLDRLKRFPDIALAGICDERRERVEDAARKYGIPAFYDWNALYDEQPDAVFITGENARHLPPASEAIRRGIAVLCEKPLGVDEKEMLDFLALVEERRGRCMTLLPNRFASPVIRAKELLDRGTIGRLLAVHATNYGKMPGGFFVEPDLAGGGSLMDHAIHVGDLTNWFVGAAPEKAWGIAGTKLHPDLRVDDISQIHYRYANGVVVTLDSSWSRHEHFPSDRNLTMTLVGEKGSLFVDLTRDRQDLYGEEKGWRMGREDKVAQMLAAAVDCLRRSAPFPVTEKDGYLATRIALMAYANLWPRHAPWNSGPARDGK